MNRLELQEQLQTLLTDNETIDAKADAEKRTLTVEEAKTFDDNLVAFNETKRNLERLDELEAQQELIKQSAGRKTKPVQPATVEDDDDEQLGQRPKLGNRLSIRPVENYALAKTGGFRNLGEMAWHVSRSVMDGGITDPRLQRLAAATTYGNEASGADGGFAVPPDFRTAIMQTVMGEDQLLPRCDQITVSGNTFTCPADETTPWQTTGGIQAYWDGEAAAATQSKPALQEKVVKLNKLRALVPMTEEAMADASQMDSYLRIKAPIKIAFKINDALINGTGVGMPLGILNSPALVTVAKETSQTNTTLIALNVMKMYSAMYGPCRPRGVWLINQDIEQYLFRLSIAGTDNVGNSVTGWGGLVYMPANGLSNSPFATLFGRPVVPTQACQTLGTLGDIIFADFSQYLTALKSGPNPMMETSIHLWFDQDLVAFKFTLRLGGMPWWGTTISAKNGSALYSPFVALAGRP